MQISSNTPDKYQLMGESKFQLYIMTSPSPKSNDITSSHSLECQTQSPSCRDTPSQTQAYRQSHLAERLQKATLARFRQWLRSTANPKSYNWNLKNNAWDNRPGKAHCELVDKIGSGSHLRSKTTPQQNNCPALCASIRGIRQSRIRLLNKVLCFSAYFKETVHESVEQYHLRVVKILYFLEDNSISVVEPPIANSGISQGVLLRRQKLLKATKEPFTAKDFNLAINISFFAKTFRIVSCDKFTEV